jgi:hypothetical protein
VIVLRSAGLIARLDPAHGGEILDLIDLSSGRQLLGRPPFASSSPLDGDVDEEGWTARYRGGWQLLTPNAGCVSKVAGELHPFHGRASNAPWDIVDEGCAAATLGWSGHGLRVLRRVLLDGPTLRAETEWVALREDAGFVAVEHIALGLELLAPSATIHLPGGVAFELSELDGPVRAPTHAPSWPDALLLDGLVERVDTFSVSEPSARFLAVQGLAEGWYEVVNDVTGQGLRVEWDVAAMPHLWLWREVRTTGGVWRKQAEILALEPASVTHSLGLARALADGEAIVLDVGARFRTRVAATPFHRSEDARKT